METIVEYVNGNTWTDIVRIIRDYLIAPGLLLIVGWLMTILKSYGERITNSIVQKNEVENAKSKCDLKNGLLQKMDTLTEAAVCSMMPSVEQMKTNNSNKKLTKEDIENLNNGVRQRVYNSIKPFIVDTDGKDYVFESQESLNLIIDGMAEKHVTHQKSLVNDNKTQYRIFP